MSTDLPVIQFGLNAETMDSCARGIVKGHKRATTGLHAAYLFDNESLPLVGDHTLVRDSMDRDIAIIEVTQVETRRYREVDAAFAAVEGAGDKSLAYWQKVHWDYLGQECERVGIPLNEDIQVVLEYFKVVKILTNIE